MLATPNTKLPQWKAADIYEDDKIDIYDLSLLKRELVK